MSNCLECIKNDVCNQRNIFDIVRGEINDINVIDEKGERKFTRAELKNKFGITIDIQCSRFLHRNTSLIKG